MEGETLEVAISDLALHSLYHIYEYGVETFALNAANIFIDELYERIYALSDDYLIHPECRYLITKSEMYRNIIHGSYLVIYRITNYRIEVLNVLHSSRSIKGIKSSRSIKI
ncbi:MAG TPA: type II toxin-antitoxin system RelE/ParE family toxin [Mucilaginibacter sp.]|nr:type II toxin-antitoxin system RelE/ParE family toxin [Mucilaginibacter sp.]